MEGFSDIYLPLSCNKVQINGVDQEIKDSQSLCDEIFTLYEQSDYYNSVISNALRQIDSDGLWKE